MTHRKHRWKELLPLCADNNNVADISNVPGFEQFINIAERRTHRFALEMVRPASKVTLKQALAFAYIQGMSDGAQLTEKAAL